MNSENATEDIVQSFIDLANVAKGLINETQQPSVEQELGRLFSSTKAVSLGLALMNRLLSEADASNASFATPTTKRTIEEIWGSKTTKKPRKSNKTTSGKVSHIVKDVFLIPDLSIKVVPRKKKRQDYYINNLVASTVKLDSMMDEKDIRCETGRSFPQYDMTNFPEFDFLKAVENIFLQPYVKEWGFY